MNDARNPTATEVPASLRLPASRPMPRKLVISWRPPTVQVMSFGSTADAPLIASACSSTTNALLLIGADGEADLVLGGAAHFPVTPAELELIRPMFCPHGLRIEQGG